MVVFTRDALAQQAETHGWSVGEHSYGTPRVLTWPNSGKLIIGR